MGAMGTSTDDRPTTLYRHFSPEGDLLYVGITFEPASRRRGHSVKPWWLDVGSTTYEHLPSRSMALVAEREAIRAEGPRYNVIHNDAPSVRLPEKARARGERVWRVESRRSGYARETTLSLGWGIDGTPMCGDHYRDEITAEDLWTEFLRRYHPEGGWARIYWTVNELREAAPFQTHYGNLKCGPMIREGFTLGMLRGYYCPTEAETGKRLNFMSLPVPDCSWDDPDADPGNGSGFVQDATGWKPSPLQHVVSIDMLSGQMPKGDPISLYA